MLGESLHVFRDSEKFDGFWGLEHQDKVHSLRPLGGSLHESVLGC